MSSLNWRDIVSAADEEAAPVPDGEYDAVLDRADVVESSTGKEMFACTFHIDTGPYKGKVLKRNIVISTENPRSLIVVIRHLQALGLPKEWVSDAPGTGAIAAELPGRYCTLKVGKGKGQYSDRSEVTDIQPPRQGVTNALPGTRPAPATGLGQVAPQNLPPGLAYEAKTNGSPAKEPAKSIPAPPEVPFAE